MIVSFSGMDCSGKSTQISELRDYLERRGHRVRVVWHRGGYSPDAERLRRFVRRLAPRLAPGPAQPEARARAFERGSVRKAWLAFAAMDTIWSLGLKLRVQSRNEVIICDRYVWDTVIDLELRFARSLPRLAALLRALVPTPDARIMLVLPLPEIRRRFDIKNEAFRDPEPVLQARYERYRQLAAEPGFRVVDATLPVVDVAASIREVIPA